MTSSFREGGRGQPNAGTTASVLAVGTNKKQLQKSELFPTSNPEMALHAIFLKSINHSVTESPTKVLDSVT